MRSESVPPAAHFGLIRPKRQKRPSVRLVCLGGILALDLLEILPWTRPVHITPQDLAQLLCVITKDKRTNEILLHP